MRWAVDQSTVVGASGAFPSARIRHGLARILAHVGEGKQLITARGAMESGQSATTRIQQLYDLGMSTFTRTRGGPPSREEIAALMEALKAVPIEELGMSVPASDVSPQPVYTRGGGFRTRPPLPVTYLPVKEVDTLHVGVFCLPARTTIPLHDHPGMTVLSRVLYGKVRVTAYDWLPNEDGAARQVVDTVVSGPAGVSALFPNWANVHSLTALTPSAVLDVLAPPYAPAGGRDCTYFRASPIGDMKRPPDSVAKEVLLEPCEPPEDFEVRRGAYAGVRVQE